MRNKEKVVELRSLLIAKTGKAVISKGTTAIYDPASGPCMFNGEVVNEGRIEISGKEIDSALLIFEKFTNKGTVDSESGKFEVVLNSLENDGRIKAANKITFTGKNGQLSVTGKKGFVTAGDEIVLEGRTGINVASGTFTAPVIRFNSELGQVSVSADELDGEVEVDAQSAKVGAESGLLDLGPQLLMASNHVYYNTGGSISVGTVSHGSDTVALLASVDVTAGAVTAGDVHIAAGTQFTINGQQFPTPSQDSDTDDSFEITGTQGTGIVTINGAFTASGNVNIVAGDVNFTDNVTVTGDLIINSKNNTITIDGDVDVDGDMKVEVYTLNFEGNDFEVDGELELGNEFKNSFLNFEGTFTAKDQVTLNAYKLEFDGDDFTMEATDKDLLTEAHMKIETTGAISIKGDISTQRAANVVLYSDGKVRTGAITVDNSQGSWAGGVFIKTNRTGGADEFIIGGTDNTNGVNGAITTDTVDGGSTDPSTFSHGNVYITNEGTGGITLTNATDISVKGTNSKSGGITLDAKDGDIKLPAGTLSADGSTGNGGSGIQLLAATIDTEDGTIISASDDGQAGKQKLIQIAADEIKIKGTSGLTLKADGDGNMAYPSTVQILPKDSVTLTAVDSDPAWFYYYYQIPNGEFNNPGEVDLAGSTSAPLTISANGSHSRVVASAYPLKFNTGETKIEAKGVENHTIQLIRYGASGNDGLQFNGGDVTIDASGESGEDSDGGYIELSIDRVLRSNTGKVTIKADGADGGNGGQIVFNPGTTDVKVGTGNEEFSFSAKGGTNDGDGGTVQLMGWSSSIEVRDAGQTSTSVDVSAPGSAGDGGEIDIVAYGSNGLSFDGTASFLKADSGSSSGNGGRITVLCSNAPLTIDTGTAGAVSLSAISNGDGDGGTIDISSWAGITAESAHVKATANGNGTGGNILLNAGYSTFTFNGGDLHADGGNTGGDGGLIHLEGGELVLPAADNTILTANALGDGNGGTIEIVSRWGTINMGADNEELQIEANATGAGNGGVFVLQSDSAYNQVTIDAAYISVLAGTNGIGGTVEIASSNNVEIDGALVANADGSGQGGIVTIEAIVLVLGEDAEISANGGESDGEGGKIELITEDEIDFSEFTDEIITAFGTGTGAGGEVKIEKSVDLDLHKVVNANAGEDAHTTCFTACVKGALVSNNGVVCREWQTGSASFPRRYWSSLNTDLEGSEGAIATAASKLHNTMKGILLGLNTEIYAMLDIAEFRKFHGFGPVDGSGQPVNTGVAGWSEESRRISGAFKMIRFSSGDENQSAYLTGTIIHELGHQLDNYWNNDAFTNTAWYNNPPSSGALDLDEVDFNNATCAVSIDTDRSNNGLAAVCGGAGTHSNIWVLHNLVKLDTASDEQWARAFADAVRRANTGIAIQKYYIDVQARFTRENSYMDDVVTNGKP